MAQQKKVGKGNEKLQL